MKKAAVCTNVYSDPGFIYTDMVCSVLEKHGIDWGVFTVDPTPKDTLCHGRAFTTLSGALKGAGIIICLGGDGTILHIAEPAARRRIPVLGINLGHRGFMTELARDDMDGLDSILQIGFECYERMMAHVCVMRGDKCVYSADALNDAVITKGVEARIIDMSVYADGVLVSEFSGDGIVVCTPTGSTAYSMSAGGPIVEPEAENLIITPVCSHSLQAKSFVLSPGRKVSVAIGELKNYRSAFISADGGRAKRLEDGDIVSVCRSQYKLRLVKADKDSFYNKVYIKLNTSRSR